jgi:hypothetical protein
VVRVARRGGRQTEVLEDAASVQVGGPRDESTQLGLTLGLAEELLIAGDV